MYCYIRFGSYILRMARTIQYTKLMQILVPLMPHNVVFGETRAVIMYYSCICSQIFAEQYFIDHFNRQTRLLCMLMCCSKRFQVYAVRSFGVKRLHANPQLNWFSIHLYAPFIQIAL